MSALTYLAPEAVKAESAFLEFVKPYLEEIELRLEREITSDVRKVHALGGHVLSAGGKRLRPAMVALSALAVSAKPNRDRLVTVGAAVELVHMATLVHDDVVDNTAMRRGKPTAGAVFGNGVAVLCGDFLLARAMRLLASDGDIHLMRIVSDITIEMSEGEVMEIQATGDPRISQSHYEKIVRKKTAAFVEGCCRCGAGLAGAIPAFENALAQYGLHLGMAFQIADDLLDYTGDPEATGKPVGSDLRDGRATLPLLLALKEAHCEDRDAILTAFGNASLDDATVASVVEVMSQYDVFDLTRVEARRHVELAENALACLPESDAKDCFATLTDYVVHRDR